MPLRRVSRTLREARTSRCAARRGGGVLAVEDAQRLLQGLDLLLSPGSAILEADASRGPAEESSRLALAHRCPHAEKDAKARCAVRKASIMRLQVLIE